MKNITGKVVVLGHQGVGKTSTVTRYVQKTFSPHIVPTVGASFFTTKVNIDEFTSVTLQIWDTAGQERFQAMTPMFYRNANAALLVYDITSKESFEHMKTWVTELKRNIEGPIVLCVVGNKIDLIKDRQVSRDEAIQYSNSIGASYQECSAREDVGVGLIFENVAMALLRLSGQNASVLNRDNENIEELLMAKSSDLEPTDVGQEEIVNLSINSIAHGSSVKPRCC